MNIKTFSSSSSNNFIIMGGGPVGCYLAYKLLNEANARVFLFEGRMFERPQVIRIPFSAAYDLPEEVKNTMWFDEEIRSKLFNVYEASNSFFWPRPSYDAWPWIKIGLFQESMIDFLRNNASCKDRFFFIRSDIDFEKVRFPSQLITLFPVDDASIIDNIKAIYCTCGTYATSLRNKLGLIDGKLREQKGHGIYLIYKNQNKETYVRDNTIMSYSKLGERGISYAASNNCHYDVQLYTYPVGDLAAVFDEMPENFMHHARYNSESHSLDMTGRDLPHDAKRWFEKYKKIIAKETKRAGVPLPSDLKNIKVYYAPRSEYYWNDVTTRWKNLNDIDVPLFFLGDSAGSTDYKLGLSVGRGLLAVDHLVNAMRECQSDTLKVAMDYQIYWNKMIIREFNKGPLLSLEPSILYQYLIKGRQVTFNHKTIHYVNDEQYEHYLDAYQHLSTDFYKTSESSSILLINTRALKENITTIVSFAKSMAHSKIMGVVKSNGYGIGAKLTADLAIAANIDFLAVAKLQEAVMLREAGVSNQVRIVAFETPMVYDLSTYAIHNIDVILPVSHHPSAMDMLTQWLQHPSYANHHPLKIHIMVDTGLRRDGGHDINLPQSVMSTILNLKNLDSTQVEFSGLSTHLACYRCTDYKGEDILNFRSLQFKRFKEVVKTLLSNGIQIPLIHMGGGLALLSEKWPMQFEEISNEFDIPLYTRVGHGIYGMELEKDLHADSPKLYPVVQFNLQVRHVFYVEEGEPISYGGHFRAPKKGVWIATLSGGWADGIPRTAQTVGEWDNGMMVSIRGSRYPVVGKINMNAMMVNLGSVTTIQPGDRAIIFGWGKDDPKLNELAEQSGHISPSIMVNVPPSIARVIVSEAPF